MPTNNHFTVYLYEVNENDFNLEKNSNYYYDGLFRDWEIIKTNKSLKEIIIDNNGIIYIYEKCILFIIYYLLIYNASFN